jgi:curved DNA-binding protein CbpA
MNDPYRVLELTPDAGENEIRQRYLELVRAFPPDQAPERFAAIHAAYAALRDPANRLREQLFGLEPKNASFESIAADLNARLRDLRLPVDMLLSWADAP